MSYAAFSNINDLQQSIMLFVVDWVKTQKTPVPKKAIIEKILKPGVKAHNISNALDTLAKKNYIKKTSGLTNKTFYIQLRSS